MHFLPTMLFNMQKRQGMLKYAFPLHEATTQLENLVRAVNSPGEKQRVGFANVNYAILTHSAGEICSQWDTEVARGCCLINPEELRYSLHWVLQIPLRCRKGPLSKISLCFLTDPLFWPTHSIRGPASWTDPLRETRFLSPAELPFWGFSKDLVDGFKLWSPLKYLEWDS